MLGNRAAIKFSEFEKESTAVHEAGHAITGVLLEEKGLDPLRFVTILPHENFLGVTVFSSDKENYARTYEYFKADLVCCMAGRAAEEIFYGPDRISSGASGDIEAATQIAKEMIGRFGYSAEVGFVNTDVLSGQAARTAYNSAANDNNGGQSLPLPANLHKEIKVLLNEAYLQAKQMLVDNIQAVYDLSTALVDQELIDREQLLAITHLHPQPPQYPSLRDLSVKDLLENNKG